jgi:porphobilinogen deaminase
MRILEGGCSVPVGVTTRIIDVPAATNMGAAVRTLELHGSVTSLDGATQISGDLSCQLLTGDTVASETGDCSNSESDMFYAKNLERAEELGAALGARLLGQGAREILDFIKAAKTSQ